MNKLINELILKATDRVEVHNPDTGVVHHREFFDREKFAELIVKECAAEIIKQNDGEEPVDSWERGYVAGINGALRAIKEHFGVE